MRLTHFLIIVSFTLLAVVPLFLPGFYTSQDGPSHLIKSYYFSQILFSGHWPGWVSDLNDSRGYPIFFFTYPFPYLLNSFWHILHFSIVDGLKIIFGLATFLSGLFFYLWAIKLSSPTKSLVATLVYLFTPYRFLNLYVRAALGEVVFLSLVPVAFYLLETRRFGWLTLILTALILSHLQLSGIFLPLFVFYAVVRKIRPRLLVRPFIFSLAISAFFWLPALVLLPLTKFSQTHEYLPVDHLASLRQLLYSPWGFGFSVPGPNDGMSFQLGLGNWLLLVISSIFFFRSPPVSKLFTLISWMAVIFMVSSPFHIWNLSFLQSVQFPWRLLGVTAFTTPALILFLPFKKTILVAFAILVLYSNRNHIRINSPDFVSVTDNFFHQTHTTTTATPDEFMPKVLDRSLFENHPILPVSRDISGLALIFFLTWEALQSRHKTHRP